VTTLTGGTVLALLAAGLLAIVLAFVVPAPLNYGIAVAYLLTGYLIVTSQKRNQS
jgi:hypothetical protein